MFPSTFDYVAPTTLEEAVSALAEASDAKVLSGGQSLIPLMKLRFAAPSVLVDINRIDGLGAIEETGEYLRIGGLARHNAVAGSELIGGRYPLLASAAPQIADPIIRNLGTMGGSLAHADPAGDWGSVMLAVGATIVATGPSGERTIPIAEFFQGTFTTALEPTEILTEIRVPKPGARSGGTYLKLERKVGDFATVGVAVQVELSNGTVARAGIGLTAVGSRNIEPTAAEEALAGADPTADAFAEAARLAAEAAQPSSDVRGSADYKRAVVRTFVRRGLERAVEIARGT